MYVGLKQPRGDGERYVTPARAAAKETSVEGIKEEQWGSIWSSQSEGSISNLDQSESRIWVT